MTRSGELALVLIILVAGCSRAEGSRSPPEFKANASGSQFSGGQDGGGATDARLFAEDVALQTLPLSLGLETLGGVTSVLIPRGAHLPVERHEVFSTAEDDQASVELRVVLGEHRLANDNRTLGKFHLKGIPPAPRGAPRIDVTFGIDSQGVLSVTARDRATGAIRTVSHVSLQAPIRRQEIEAMVAPTPDEGASGVGSIEVPPGADGFRARLFAEDVPLPSLPLSVGLETLGGATYVLLPRGAKLPATHHEIFSTSGDNQDSVELRVVVGERAISAKNRTVGKLHLKGIPPAPRASPEIDVTFAVDSHGALYVNARERTSGTSCKVLGGSGDVLIHEQEVDAMLEEASAAHAEDDSWRTWFHDRNELDALVHRSRDLLARYGSRISAALVGRLQEAIRSAEDTLKSAVAPVDLGRVHMAAESLQNASHAASEALYAAPAR